MITTPREVPLLKIAISTVIGIFLQDFLSLGLWPLGISCLLSFASLVLLQMKRGLGLIHRLRTLMVYLCFLFLGAFLFQSQEVSIRNTLLDDRMFDDIEVIVTCVSIPKQNKMTQFEAKISHLCLGADSCFSIKPINTLVHVFDSIYSIEIGDKARVRGIFKNTSRSNSPLTFDYSRYLKFRKIAYQTYVPPQDIEILENRKETSWPSEARKWAIDKFKMNLTDTNVAIASALVLGHRGLINDDMYEAFAQTGSMHVLAVSGLHVGIVSWLLGLILRLVKSNKTMARITKSVVLLIGIWSFALITGSSPSVMRASLMFSFLEIGKMWQGHYSVYNSIGAAALILLIVDPFILFHVGFQLSFSAILSIVIFYSKINCLIVFKSSILHYLWSLMTVALSVQVLTLPISLHYFHQFPVYFPITGITAVLLAVLILTSGLILLLLSLILSVPLLWSAFDGLVGLLAKSTYWVHSLPYGLIPDVPFDVVSVVLAFLSIGILSFYIFNAHKKALILGLASFLMLIFHREYQHFDQFSKAEMVIYDTRKPLVDVYIEGIVYSYADSLLTDKNISFATRNYRIHKRVSKVILLDSEAHLKAFCKENRSYVEGINELDVSSVYDRSSFTPKNNIKD